MLVAVPGDFRDFVGDGRGFEAVAEAEVFPLAQGRERHGVEGDGRHQGDRCRGGALLVSGAHGGKQYPSEGGLLQGKPAVVALAIVVLLRWGVAQLAAFKAEVLQGPRDLRLGHIGDLEGGGIELSGTVDSFG